MYIVISNKNYMYNKTNNKTKKGVYSKNHKTYKKYNRLNTVKKPKTYNYRKLKIGKNTKRRIQKGGITHEEFMVSVTDLITSIISNQHKIQQNIKLDQNKNEMRINKNQLLDLLNSLEVSPNDDNNILNIQIPTQVPIYGTLTQTNTYVLFLILYNIIDDDTVIKCIKILKKKGADMNVRNWYEENAIFGEITGKVLGVPRFRYLSTLIEYGVDPDDVSPFNVGDSKSDVLLLTPLIYLLLDSKKNADNLISNYTSLRILLTCGVDINKSGEYLKDKQPISPLSITIMINRDPRNTQLLIDNGVDTNIFFEFNENGKKLQLPPIIEAIRTGQLLVADVLMSAPITNLNIICSIGSETHTPLTITISIIGQIYKKHKQNPVNEDMYKIRRKDFLFFISRLINDPRTDVNLSPKLPEKNTPLIIAILNEDIELIKLLFDSPKIEINKENGHNNNALFVACILNNIEIVRLILTKPNVDTKKSKMQIPKEMKEMWKLLNDYDTKKTVIIPPSPEELAIADAKAREMETELLASLELTPTVPIKQQTKRKTKETSKKELDRPELKPAVAIRDSARETARERERVKEEELKQVAATRESAREEANRIAMEEKQIVDQEREQIRKDKKLEKKKKKAIQETISDIIGQVEEKSQKEITDENIKENEKISKIAHFWLPIIERITGDKQSAIKKLNNLKQYILGLINVDTRDNVCNILKNNLMEHYAVYDIHNKYLYTQYEKEMCACGIIMSIITDLLDRANVCILLLKGGKAIQMETIVNSNDFDFMIVPKLGNNITAEEQREIAYEINNLLFWLIQDNTIDFKLSSAFYRTIERGQKELLSLSGPDANEMRAELYNSKIDVNSIIKISVLKRDKTGFLAALDIGYGFEYLSPLIKDIYLHGILMKNKDSMKFCYMKLEALLHERIYYWLLYKSDSTLQRENDYFLKKLPGSLLIILTTLSIKIGEPIYIILGKNISYVYRYLYGEDIDFIKKRIIIYDLLKANNIKLKLTEIDQAVESV